MMHYDVLIGFKNKVISYVDSIFKDSGEGLLLKLGDYNLLENENNCIEASTAIGYIIEEFLVSKLVKRTRMHHYEDGDYRIDRPSEDISTTQISYDCSSWINENLFAMINVKANKGKRNINNAVSAVGNLYHDFVEDRKELPKCYMVLKVFYQFGNSEQDKQRKMFVIKTEAFFIDEIDFSVDHKQDYRNWKKNGGNPNAGRLQVSQKFRAMWTFSPEKISYENTRASLKCIYDRNALLIEK